MPATFDKLGICFEYPENWSVEIQEDTPGNEQVVLSSSHTAFWQLSKQPAETELEPLFDEALAALRAEYQEMDVEPTEEILEGHLIVGYTVNFFLLDLTNTCWIKGIETPEANFLLIAQAEDREFEEVHRVFEAMLASVLRNLNS
ncbi:hypothetical protein [Bythopirellula polymerisocia]|uniref:Uncharacterized protein n=1 Tax=Bythopirellula polymerisocia TaxID=2528003 RepID=A0A5C6CKH1_9BACT|nr:hypothetical protein [Bythopirellula polymerisocia]TWU23626.1 hypothetical protein Pla144_38010 [Bythopirellula polymerisocia]